MKRCHHLVVGTPKWLQTKGPMLSGQLESSSRPQTTPLRRTQVPRECERVTSCELLNNQGPPAPLADALQRGDFPSPVGHEVSDSGLPGPLPNRQQEMSEGEALLVGMWVGVCRMLEHTWSCPSLGACPLPQQSHTVYHVACFVYIKGRVFFNIFPNYPCNDTNLQ